MAGERRDYALSQQMNRAAVSTLANIAEGYLRGRRTEFAQFVRIAAGSNGEVRACLYVFSDRGYLTAAALAPLIDGSNQIGKMLQGLLKSLQRRDISPTNTNN